MVTRREFLDALAVGAAGLAVGTTAKSYSQILGSNERVNFAVIGLNSRGYAHLSSLKANRTPRRISHVCDVDSNILKKFARHTQQEMGEAPCDRKGLSQNSRAERCGRHHHRHSRPLAYAHGYRRVAGGQARYVEKPCSHNPAEGEMLVQAQQKYRKLVQMGTQQRSSPHTIEIVDKIHNGLIGQAVFRESLVRQRQEVDRHGQGSSRARRNLIGICGRGQRRAPVQRQCPSL